MSQTAEHAAIREKYTPKPPKAVADASAEADRQIAALAAAKNGQPVPVAPPAPVPPPAQPQPPAQPMPPAQPQPPVAPVPPGDPAPPATQPLAEGETWEQRARSAEGRMAQLARANQDLVGRFGELENALAALRAAGAAPPAPAPEPLPRLITPEEETEYGTEMLTVVGKRAREEIAPEIVQLRGELANLKGRLDGTVQLVQGGRVMGMYELLDSKIPNWRDVNQSPQFKDWLSVRDPFSGRTRSEMLLEAHGRQDGQRVLNFFQGYAEAAGLPQTPPAPVATTPPPSGQPVAPTLEDFAAPGRARSAPQSPMPPEKPVYTSASIARFFHDKLQGKWKGRENDAALIEQDIFAAQHEGRIIV